MLLVIILRFLVGKQDVHADLVGLVDDGTMTGDHLSRVELCHARNGFQIFVSSGEQFIRGLGLSRISPKDDNV